MEDVDLGLALGLALPKPKRNKPWVMQAKSLRKPLANRSQSSSDSGSF